MQGVYGLGGIIPAKPRETERQRAAAPGFLQMVARGGAGLLAPETAAAAGKARPGEAQAVQPASLKEMLQAKYPGLHYHVFDASSSYWRTRNDYPHYLLYQDGEEAKKTLENWRPSGANPFYGSVDGRFIAPKEIHALGSVPPGSKAVVIHPAVQERMGQDPDYAQQIYAKIDSWFAFDVARNEAMHAGSTVGMAQAVAIGADGNIANACASTPGGGFTFSKSGPDEDIPSGWELRLARHAELMKRLVEEQLERKAQAFGLSASMAAKTQLARMLDSGSLPEIFGSEIAGMPTETILALTREQVWGSGAGR